MFNFFGKKEEETTQDSQINIENSEDKKKFFSIGLEALKQKVSNTSKILVEKVESENEFSDFVLDDMEDLLIRADLGVNYASELVDGLRKQNKIKPSDIKSYLKNEFTTTLNVAGSTSLLYKENSLNIYFITGVNG